MKKPSKSKHLIFGWKVASKSASVYLMGSIHARKSSAPPLNPAFEKAFEKCDTLAVEVDITPYPSRKEESIWKLFFVDFLAMPSAVAFLSLITYSMGIIQINSIYHAVNIGVVVFFTCLKVFRSYKTRDTLTLDLLEKALKRAEITGYRKFRIKYLENLAMVTIPLMNALQKKVFGDFMLGVDRHFLSLAKKKEMKVVELEDYQTQQIMLGRLQWKPHFSSILSFLKDFEAKENNMKKELKAYNSGDVTMMREVISFEEERYVDYEKIILVERDLLMVKRIKEFLKGDQNVYLLIGGQHYAGSQGILALLRKEGYTPEQLSG